MTTIARVATQVLPVRNTALSTSYGSPETAAKWRTHLFVRVETVDGNAGVAEGSPLPHFSGEYAEAMARVINEKLGPVLVGRDLHAIEEIQVALEHATAGQYASKSTLINALYDAQGRQLGLPVSRLLGGPLVGRLQLAGAVGLIEPDPAIAALRSYYDTGIRTFKIKVGQDVRRDAALLAAVRSEFGSAVQLRADANGAFNRADARRFLELIRPHDLQYVEQPLPAADLSGLAELRRLGTVPIAVDESLYGLRDALEIVRQEAADVFIIKLIKLGGLNMARKVAAVAEGAGISCVTVSPYETALGASATMQLASSTPVFPWAVEVGAGPLQINLDGIQPLKFENGHVLMPEGPGLGVNVPAAIFDNVLPDGQNG